MDELDPLDSHVVTTLAASIRNFRTRGGSLQAGQEFEQLVFRDMLDAHTWRYATGPDQFGMGLQLASRTGTEYEFDGVFGTDTTLFVIEAKHLTHGSLTREHVGIFLQKLLDTMLGSYHDLARFVIKPIVVSAQPTVDAAAYRHAIAWGILLVSPNHPTPYELLAAVENQQLPARVAQRLLRDCPTLASRLWRPFNQILTVAHDRQQMHFALHAEHIYSADQSGSVLDFWNQCALESRPM